MFTLHSFLSLVSAIIKLVLAYSVPLLSLISVLFSILRCLLQNTGQYLYKEEHWDERANLIILVYVI